MSTYIKVDGEKIIGIYGSNEGGCIEVNSWPMYDTKNPVQKKFCKFVNGEVVRKTDDEISASNVKKVFTDEQVNEIKKIISEVLNV